MKKPVRDYPIRRDAISALLGEHFVGAITLLDVEDHTVRSIERGCDWQFMFDPYTMTISMPKSSDLTPRLSKITVLVVKDSAKFKRNELMAARDWLYAVSIPIKMLQSEPKKYHLYNVSFGFTSAETCPFDEESNPSIAVGYYGITGRHFLERFQEHAADAAKGKGHLLHRVWNQMLTKNFDFMPMIRLAGSVDSLDDIYELEELAVRDTLMPKGLNVIPGGREGIRFLHTLRTVERLDITPEERDAALTNLENGKKASHYRTGHIHNLASGKVTWVKPCWINLPNGSPQ